MSRSELVLSAVAWVGVWFLFLLLVEKYRSPAWLRNLVMACFWPLFLVLFLVPVR